MWIRHLGRWVSSRVVTVNSQWPGWTMPYAATRAVYGSIGPATTCLWLGALTWTMSHGCAIAATPHFGTHFTPMRSVTSWGSIQFTVYTMHIQELQITAIYQILPTTTARSTGNSWHLLPLRPAAHWRRHSVGSTSKAGPRGLHWLLLQNTLLGMRRSRWKNSIHHWANSEGSLEINITLTSFSGIISTSEA